MDQAQRQRIRQEFFEIKDDAWDMAKNPVVKVHLSVWRQQQNLRISEIGIVDDGTAPPALSSEPTPTSTPTPATAPARLAVIPRGTLRDVTNGGAPVTGVQLMGPQGEAFMGRVQTQYQHLSQQATLESRSRDQSIAALRALILDQFGNVFGEFKKVNKNLCR